jgi:DNA replication protein DnaC
MSEAMEPVETPQLLLDHHLKTLRLPTMLREYDRVARQCAAEDLDYPRYLLRMAELELLDRERRATERRVRQAKFPVTKSLDSFDFLAMPTLNKAMVLELARCEFLTRRENVLLLGNSGTGKTHIALALGLAACQQGHRVRFTTAAALVHELIEARDERKLLRFQKQIASYELLIVDELGFVPLSKTERNCSSRCSASATSAARPCSPATCPSPSGPRSSVPNASPEPCSTGLPTTSTSWR